MVGGGQSKVIKVNKKRKNKVIYNKKQTKTTNYKSKKVRKCINKMIKQAKKQERNGEMYKFRYTKHKREK